MKFTPDEIQSREQLIEKMKFTPMVLWADMETTIEHFAKIQKVDGHGDNPLLRCFVVTVKEDDGDTIWMGDDDGDEVLARVFEAFDAGGSGKLSADAVRSILTRSVSDASAWPLMHEPLQVQRVINAADVNGDGLLPISELVRVMKAMYPMPSIDGC